MRAAKLQNIPTWVTVVAAAMQDADGRWLMHRRPPEKHHGGLWEFPGGKVESTETPALALVREISEELGIVLDVAQVLPVAFADREAAQDGSEIVILLYTCTKWEGTPQALEGGAIGWFDSREVLDLPKPPLDRKLAGMLLGRCPG